MPTNKKKKKKQKTSDSASTFLKIEPFEARKIKIVNMTLAPYTEQAWCQVLEQTSFRIAHIKALASRFIHFYYCAVLQKGETIPPLKHFVRNMFGCFSTAVTTKERTEEKEKERLVQTFKYDQQILRDFLQELPWVKISSAGITNILTFAANQYSTNLYLYHTLNLKAHYQWFLQAKYQVTKKVAKAFISRYWPTLQKEINDQADSDLDSKGDEEEQEINFLSAQNKSELERLTLVELSHLNQEFTCFLKKQNQIQSQDYSTCVRFHYHLLCQMEEINQERTNKHLQEKEEKEIRQQAVSPHLELVRTWAMCPVTNQARTTIRVDENGLSELFKAFFVSKEEKKQNRKKKKQNQEAELNIPSLFDIFSKKDLPIQKGWHLGSSFLTDGVQLQIQYEKKIILHKKYTKEKEWIEAQQKKKEKQEIIEKYNRQQEEVKKGKEATEEKIDGKRARIHLFTCEPSKPTFHSHGTSLLAHKNGFFQTSSLLAHPEERQHFTRVVSIDPGRTNILSCGLLSASLQSLSNESSSFSWDFLKDLTCGSYYTSIGQRTIRTYLANKKQTNQQIRQEWYELLNVKDAERLALLQTQQSQKIQQIEEQLSKCVLRTTQLNQIIEHVKLFLSFRSQLVDFYGSRNLARLSFELSKKKMQFREALLQELAPSIERDRTLLLVGNAKFAVSSKGTSPSPVRALIDFLSRHVRVVLVDEFNTTKMCPHCTEASTFQIHPAIESPLSRKHDRLDVLQPSIKQAKILCVERGLTFQPMACYKREVLPQKVLTRLTKRILDPVKRDACIAKMLCSDIHGLRRCVCCLRIYNRDHVAYQNIGNKALSLWLRGQVAAPFDRSLYSQVAHSSEQKQRESNHSESSPSSSSSSSSQKSQVNPKKRKRSIDCESVLSFDTSVQPLVVRKNNSKKL